MPRVADRQTDATTAQKAKRWSTLRMLGWGLALVAIGVSMVVRTKDAGGATYLTMSAPILVGGIILVRAVLEFV